MRAKINLDLLINIVKDHLVKSVGVFVCMLHVRNDANVVVVGNDCYVSVRYMNLFNWLRE